jgi:hypothetical protein
VDRPAVTADDLSNDVIADIRRALREMRFEASRDFSRSSARSIRLAVIAIAVSGVRRS